MRNPQIIALSNTRMELPTCPSWGHRNIWSWGVSTESFSASEGHWSRSSSGSSGKTGRSLDPKGTTLLSSYRVLKSITYKTRLIMIVIGVKTIVAPDIADFIATTFFRSPIIIRPFKLTLRELRWNLFWIFYALLQLKYEIPFRHICILLYFNPHPIYLIAKWYAFRVVEY